MKGTRIHLNNLLHDTGWNFGVKAYDDYANKVFGFGHSAYGIARTVLETAMTKKYRRVNEQIIPQLCKEEYFAEIILAAVHHTTGIIYKWTTVSAVMDALESFNLSRYMVENYLRGMVETGKLKAVELRSGLENIYT